MLQMLSTLMTATKNDLLVSSLLYSEHFEVSTRLLRAQIQMNTKKMIMQLPTHCWMRLNLFPRKGVSIPCAFEKKEISNNQMLQVSQYVQ